MSDYYKLAHIAELNDDWPEAERLYRKAAEKYYRYNRGVNMKRKKGIETKDIFATELDNPNYASTDLTKDIQNIKDEIKRLADLHQRLTNDLATKIHLHTIDETAHPKQQRTLYDFGLPNNGRPEGLPARHHEPWDIEENAKFNKALDLFISLRARIHQRTEPAIISRVQQRAYNMIKNKFGGY
jgi:hypothetical protein